MAQPLVVKKDDDLDEEEYYSPFLGIEKGAVLQEARVFHDPQLDARRCCQVITKLLYLLNQGDTFTKVEATEVFFATTKLFQSKDAGLRRMVYLMIKELSPSADEVAECWFLLCSYVHFVGSEIDFICVSSRVGYYCDKFSDEGYE
uniref:Clathrin/coatomer adaptor adaptin-like N-terminal domain-containing protein n=1 Tax=Aegilops tauschii subsp. strangulata TaxID=200361 RepID=A0A452YGD9_AEGTS